jgi:hypothetical protein
MVTHNEELARQVPRTVTVINGEIGSDTRRTVMDGPCADNTPHAGGQEVREALPAPAAPGVGAIAR